MDKREQPITLEIEAAPQAALWHHQPDDHRPVVRPQIWPVARAHQLPPARCQNMVELCAHAAHARRTQCAASSQGGARDGQKDTGCAPMGAGGAGAKQP